MKNILVPCDFSAQARNAFQSALSISDGTISRIHLLHVIEVPVLQDPLMMPVPTFEEGLFGELEQKARDQFEKMVGVLPAGVSVETKVAYGATFNMIIDYITEFHIDLVIMGTRGASGIREILIGSNTEKVVRQSPVPVLVVRKPLKKDDITDIVFPNTLDTGSQDKLVQQVKDLQTFFNAKLHLVWINTPSHFLPDHQTRERMKAFADRFNFSNYTMNIFNDIYEESGIVNFTHEVNGNMLAMGTHGRKGLSHFFAGSVTEDVVNHIDTPIWTFTLRQN